MSKINRSDLPPQARLADRKRRALLRRATEAQLRKTATDLVAELSHQINQPLAAIAAYAQGCAHRMRANTLDPADLLKVFDEITHEALRAGDIVRGLRERTRVKGQKSWRHRT